jgi:hypothetical protein
VTRALACALVVALLGAGVAPGAKPKGPSPKDRAAALRLANSAEDFLSGIDALEARMLTQVKRDYALCASSYQSKVDATRLADLETFLSQARAMPGIPALWRSMMSRWDALHVQNPTLRLVVATAHTQADQVRRLGQAPSQPGICDALASWEAGGWSNTFVGDLASAWSNGIPVDGSVIQAARGKVQATAPQLHALGLGDAQISSVVQAVL